MFKLLGKIISFLGCAILALLTILVFLQVIFRYVLQIPISWSEEIARYMMVWIVYIGSILAMKYNSHVRINLLENYLVGKKKVRKYLNIVEKILSISYMCIIIYSGWLLIPYTIFQRTPLIRIPMGIIHIIIPLSAALMALYMGIELFFSIKNINCSD